MLKRKVLLIGWDAADWKIINPMIDAGIMPSLSKLVSEGVMGNLSTLDPPYSPMLWTSIATGKYADKHGILGFTEPGPQGAGILPVSSASRKTKAVWNILSQNNFRTHVLGWWPSYPAEPINGIMISNHFPKAITSLEQPWPLTRDSVHPKILEEFFAELRVHPEELTEQHILPFVPDAASVDQKEDKRLGIIAKNLAEAATLHNAATWILETQPWDFLALYLDMIDHLSHGFMKYHPPRLKAIPETDFELYRNVITATYRFHDMMLETLIRIAGPDATVILVSDHGFHSDHLRTSWFPDEPAGPAEHHRDHGIICMKGPGIKRDELIHGCSLLNITPTILSLYGLPCGRDMDGIPLVQAFQDQPKISIIPSWDQVPGMDGMHPASVRRSPIAEKQALRQLIDLGYIEDPGSSDMLASKKAEQELQYNLARVYSSTFRHKEAIEILEKLYANDHCQGRIAIRLAKNYSETGDTKKALKVLQEFITDASEFLRKTENVIPQDKPESNKIRNTNNKVLKNPSNQIITLRNSIAHARLMLLDLRIIEENPKEIIRMIDREIPLKKRTPSMEARLAVIFYRLKEYENSIACFRKLAEYDPENPFSCNGLTLIHMARGRYMEAAGTALDSLGLNYYQPFVHYQLGESLYRLKDYVNAVNAYEVCLKILPSFGKARNRLITIYSDKLDEPEKAREHKDFFKKTRSLNETKEEDEELLILGDLQSKMIKLHDPLIVVSGFPRSGTSLIMQMLYKGGLPVYADNSRPPDEHNPKGYFEHKAVKSLRKNKKWLLETRGKAVKIVSHLLPFLPARYNYKVIFMLRDLSEVVNSQHRMLVKLGKSNESVYPANLELNYRDHLQKTAKWFIDSHNVSVLYLNYRDVIADPGMASGKIREFLDVDLNIDKMISVVDPDLYHQKH